MEDWKKGLIPVMCDKEGCKSQMMIGCMSEDIHNEKVLFCSGCDKALLTKYPDNTEVYIEDSKISKPYKY